MWAVAISVHCLKNKQLRDCQRIIRVYVWLYGFFHWRSIRLIDLSKLFVPDYFQEITITQVFYVVIELEFVWVYFLC